jgi:GNAT superfamily N-acetyltransferase
MSTDALSWTEARTADADVVLELMAAFYAEERLVFDPQAAGEAVRTLMAKPEFGRIFLLKESGVARVEKPVDVSAGREAVSGHLVVTWGFSLEFRGRYVLLDELYLKPEFRGKGRGRSGIEFAAVWARDQGAASLRLEVTHPNRHAKEVYQRRDFGDDRRDLMTRWL